MKQDAGRVVAAPELLLPQCIDMQKWSVVACDQFTSDGEYWKNLYSYVGDSPSALRLILPEHYLGSERESEIYKSIPVKMREYYNGGIFSAVNSFVRVRRTFKSGKTRNGIVAAVDLTAYDYKKGNKALIRATEGTVESRLPARVKIRSECMLELPHIMLFIDDPKNIVFGAADKCEGKTLYDFDLNCGGGHIRGAELTNTKSIYNAFDKLKSDVKSRYGEELLLLVGDGNHSLAAAKKCYEQALAAGDESARLKRYALCEIVNLYDEGIEFEPIHRAVLKTDPELIYKKLKSASCGLPVKATARGGGKEYYFNLPQNPIEAVAFVQEFLESGVPGEVDYIHGEGELKRLSEKSDCFTITLPPISKNGFTEYIIKNGILPKKTFSMGHAEEKRYYLEARKISN